MCKSKIVLLCISLLLLSGCVQHFSERTVGINPEQTTLSDKENESLLLKLDTNRDGIIDYGDFFQFAEAFNNQTRENIQKFDYDGNGIIDTEDFFLLANNFGKDVKIQRDSNQNLQIWPKIHYSKENNAFLTDISGNIIQPKLKWRTSLKGWPFVSPIIGDVDNDNKPEIIIATHERPELREDGQIVALNGEDGQYLWSINKVNIWSNPALGDIDNDGNLEIAVIPEGGILYVLEGKSGEIKWTFDSSLSHPGSVVIHDFDKDGKKEVLFSSSEKKEGKLFLINSDGKEVWSYRTEYIPSFHAIPAIADIDKNGQDEIIFIGIENENKNALFILDGQSGKLKNNINNKFILSHSFPVVYDVENDGELEIIVGVNKEQSSELVIYNNLLRRKYSFDIPLGKAKTGILNTATIADVNSDDKSEIFIGTENNVIAFDIQTGNIWISPDIGYVESSATIADIDSDGTYDLIVGAEKGLFAFDTLTGKLKWRINDAPFFSPLTKGPNDIKRTYIDSSPTIFDIDEDGKAEIVIGLGADGAVIAIDSEEG